MEIRERRCIVTGDILAADMLIRFVVAPDGNMVPDLAACLPGRGYWVKASKDVVEEAVRRHIFIKQVARRIKEDASKAVNQAENQMEPASKRQVPRITVTPDLADRVEALLLKNCLNLLGLARKAGQLVTGFEKVRECLERTSNVILLQASDAAEGGAGKLQHRGKGACKVGIFMRSELSLALGRENVVHAALQPGGIGDRFLKEAGKLAEFRGQALTGGQCKDP